MTQPRRSRGGAARALNDLRARADDRVGSQSDIVGSMIGVKVIGGRPSGRLSLTYLVAEKIPQSDLAPRNRIPKRIVLDGSSVATDVLAWPRMAQQSLATANMLFDQRQQGALTCFGASPFGLFGVSCAHCLSGVDGDPATPTPVEMFSADLGRLVRAGDSNICVMSPGPGAPGNFGYVDCGLFSLTEASLIARAQAARPLATVEDVLDLVGTTVRGRSSLRNDAWPDPRRTATLIGVNKWAVDDRADMVLQVDAPGTFHGDSGLLWTTSRGAAVGIHARGDISPTGSRLTTAMSAHRAAALLNVVLLKG